jgi:poly-gamma-glutamate capsule biosynthesis protein CapA/YwtB (metallophosphatase superfamily)
LQVDEPSPRTLERRRARRQQEIRWLLAALAFAAGVLIGWLVVGWTLLPPNQSDPRDLSPNAKTEYVALVVDSWSLNRDTALARERLRGLDPQEVTAILRDLNAEYRQVGGSDRAARVGAFAASYGLSLGDQAAALAPTPKLTGTPKSTSTPAPTRTPNPIHLSIASDVTGTLRAAVETFGPNVSTASGTGGNANLTITSDAQPGSVLLAERVYVVADRFPTLRTGMTQSELRGLWQGQPTSDGAKTLLATDEAYEALTRLYGLPAASVQVLPLDSIVARLWSAPQPGVGADHSALAVVPFDQLTPKLTALPLDGVNVLAHDFKIEQYPLVAHTYIGGDPKLIPEVIAALRPTIPLTNRDPDRITTVIMTGTTAIARSSAVKIDEKRDPAYPARVIAPVLSAADITHVSNEISFVDNCTPLLNTTVFCSKPSYMATFKLAGVKIVGLTGNHLLDYGTQPFLKTLDMYDAAGLRYYGGGRNAEEGGKTLFLQDHGNKLAFLGANSFGPAFDWATAERPGSNKYDAAGMKKQIAAARAQADVVFVELQAEETYDYKPSGNNQIEFRAVMASGADVVTGVQAHHPQAVELSADGRRIILYGLGNLFFDQMFDLGVRQGLIARHTIYEGRLLQTELLTTMLEDYVQPRWATPAERTQILDSVLAASGFK